MQILPIIVTLAASSHCYHRNFGPVFGAFNPTYTDFATECTETNQHSCLVLPTKKICREKLNEPLSPFVPIPWWYFYCKWVVTFPPAPTTKSSTIHPFYRKTLNEVLEYKKSLMNKNRT